MNYEAYARNVTRARSSRAVRSVTADARKDGAPSGTTMREYSISFYNTKMIYSRVDSGDVLLDTKKRSPASVIVSSNHVRSRCPDESIVGRIPRGNHSEHGPSTLSLFDRCRLLWRSSPLVFRLVAELLTVFLASIGALKILF